jgi:hypothetical protein
VDGERLEAWGLDSELEDYGLVVDQEVARMDVFNAADASVRYLMYPLGANNNQTT